jgi:AraC-like DNA-binding protein
MPLVGIFHGASPWRANLRPDMTSTTNLIALLIFLGLAQGLFLALVFMLTRQGNRPANRVLGVLLLVISLIMGEILAGYTDLLRHVPWFINLTEPLDFLIGPLFYWYTSLLVKPQTFRWPRQWVHLVPALAFAVLRLPYLMQSTAYKIQDVDLCYHRPVANLVRHTPIWWFPDYHFGGLFMDATVFPHILAYQVASFLIIRRFCRQRNEPIWHQAHQSLRWLVRLATWHTLLVLAAIVFTLVSEHDLGDIYIAASFSLVMAWLMGLVVYQSAVLAHAPPEAGPGKKKYEKSGLATEQAEALVQRLTTLMATEKPHLDGDLTLPQLASRLHSTPHHVSQLLNHQFGKSFADFLNEYRTAELKSKLANPGLAHLKIEDLAYDSGFNSKSVYNVVFKKMTGLTPSQYRKQGL